MKNILIVGAGSIGALMGASLFKAGLRVTFAGKPGSSHTKELKEEGLQLLYANGERLWISPLHPRVEFVDTATNLGKKFDIIIVAVKSNNLIKVVPYITAHSTPDTILIHAQNGIPYWWFNNDSYLSTLNQTLFNKLSSQRYLNTVDHQGFLHRNLGDRTLVGCVVKAPCQRIEEGKIQVKKIPRIILGLTRNDNDNLKQQAQIKDLCNLFTQHGIAATYTNKIRTAVCNKLVINITTNVLSALTGKVIADLTANYYTNSLIKTIIAEVNHIFSCYGIKPEDLPTEQAIYAYIKAPGSQSHLPSLAQDFSQHKPGEISLITAPVEMAQIAHLRVPTLSILSELLQLCQTYSLRNHNGESHILTIDYASDNYMLTSNVCQSSIVDRWRVSKLLAHLVQVNAVTLNNQMVVG
jgi:2-dehydropantoate 2-reductase